MNQTNTAVATEKLHFGNAGGLMQAPPLALTSGLHDLELDNPFLKVTDPAVIRRGAVDTDDDWLSSQSGSDQTLDDYLLEQVYLEFRDVPLRKVLIQLIGYLEPDGYLRKPLREVEAQIGCSHEMAQDALAILQTLDPTGVGARDLRECLLLQLDADPSTTPLVRDIVSQALPAVADNATDLLCQQFDATEDELAAAVARIKRLSPAPGSYYARPRVRTAVPEVEITVDKDTGTVVASLLRDSMVKVAFDDDYYGELVKSRDGKLRRFLSQQRKDYDYLSYNLKKRYEILLTVGEYIADAQKDYFLSGAPLNKLLVRDAVAVTKLSAGQIHRALNGHYLKWQGEVKPLSQFFSHR
ncbi:RNA polymerase factor sigma-54 [Lacticaseibacillus sharpeae]|nr:hypothetical protein [Lacticaseibacillus sharpeae]